MRIALVGCSIVLSVVAVAAQPAGEKPVIIGSPALVLETQATSGSVAVDVLNDSDKPMTLHLSASPAQDAGQGATLSIKGQPPDAASLDLTIRPHELQRIAILVSAADAGDFDFDLLNGADRLGRIPVRHKPFTVHFAEPKATLRLSEGKPTDIALENDDPVAHGINWRLRADGRDICAGQVVIASKSAAPLTCTPKFGWGFWTIVSTFFRPMTSSDAALIFDSPVAGGPPLSVAPVVISSEHFSGPFQQGLNYSILLLVLAVGGIISLLLSQIVPNRLSRLGLRERLDELDRTISGLGKQTDSGLRVLLRVELSRLYGVLNSRRTYSPEFVSVINECSAGIDRLKRRTTLVLQLETVLRRIRRAETGIEISWTQSKTARVNARHAQELLRNAVPSEAELIAAEKAVIDAAQPIELDADADPAFWEMVKGRVEKLKAVIPKSGGALAEWDRVTKEVPLLLEMVTEATADSSAMPAVAIDRAVTKLELLQTYVRHRSGVTDDTQIARMNEAEKTFIRLLQNSNVTAIGEATILLQEIRDDVYRKDLKEALQKKEARIFVDPSQICARIPLQFSIRFNDPRLDRAVAARAECQCRWDFPDQMAEQTWEVTHYFVSKDSRGDTQEIVKATFTNRGEPLVEADGKTPVVLDTPVTVKPARNRQWFGERTVVEIFKLVAALMIAAFGLIAGAREEIVKMDILSGIVAVFLIGFGADTIKSLLSSAKT